MSNGTEMKEREFTVHLKNGEITVQGNPQFNKDKYNIHWVREAGADWDLYNIAFGAPGGFIPEVFPISKVKVTPEEITAENDNKGNDQKESTSLPYVLFILKDGQVIASDAIVTESAYTGGIKADEPLQLENEPNGT